MTENLGISPQTYKRIKLMQNRLQTEDLDEAINTAFDFMDTLIDMGGEANLINDSTGKGFKVSVKSNE